MSTLHPSLSAKSALQANCEEFTKGLSAHHFKERGCQEDGAEMVIWEKPREKWQGNYEHAHAFAENNMEKMSTLYDVGGG